MNAAVPAEASGEKPIEKKVLHAGTGPELDFVKGTKVLFHFVTKLGENVLDDSRKWEKKDGEPMELIVGKKFKMEAWEMCLQTMRLNEVSSFKVKPIYSSSYPGVAKTLRDAFQKKKKTDKEDHRRSAHVCGMMAMASEGGITGYDDLNELAKQPKELEFVMELMSVESPDSYAKEAWQMEPEEKLESVDKLREEGNKLYAEKDLHGAADKYADALGRLEQLLLREKPNDEEWLKLRKQKVPLLLNYSQCKLVVNDFYPVIEHCTEVLDIETDNVKALFRRGKANTGAWNPTDAKKDFERVSELDKSLMKACQRELKGIEALEKEKDREDKEKLKNLF